MSENELRDLRAKYNTAEANGIKKADIIQCLQEGLTLKEIAFKYRLTLEKLERYIYKWNVGRPIKHKHVYLQLKEKGLKDREVCQIWDISMRTLYRWKHYWETITTQQTAEAL